MAQVIHRRGKHYRLWDSFSDRYTTGEMTRRSMVALLVATGDQHPRAIEDRMARADEHGSSALTSLGNPSPRTDKEWEWERCQFCSDFHHPFRRQDDGACRDCDSGEDDLCHHAPCTMYPELDAGPTVAQRLEGWTHLWEVTLRRGDEIRVLDVLARRIPNDSRAWEWGVRNLESPSRGKASFPSPGHVVLHVTSILLNHIYRWELQSIVVVAPA